MSPWIWGIVMVAAIWAAKWGADQMVEPLKKVRRQWGITQVAGASLLAILTASPEVGISTVSAIRNSGDIGLGTLLGSNIIAIPLIMTVAYVASRKKFGGDESDENQKELEQKHQEHLQEHLISLSKRAATVLSLPYIGIILIVAILTMPPGWRGLQPIDGWIMLGVFFLFLGQALWRGRKEGEDVKWSKKQIKLAALGAVALIAGAYFTVTAAENVISAIGISQIIGGIFITGTLSTAPEVFKTWQIVGSGQTTAGSTSVIGDKAITLSLGLVPLALVTTPINDFQLFWINMVFVTLMPVAFSLMVLKNKHSGLKLWNVLLLDAFLLLYIFIILKWVLNLF